jgi:hypothetical protein
MEDQREPREDPRELRQDALVEKLVSDPSKIPDIQVLVGLLGRSSQAETWRLYLTPQLNEYVEFNAQDVVLTHPLAAGQSPLGGTMVWLRRDATVKYTRTGTLQAQADFVRGDIMSRFMTRPGMQEMTSGAQGGRGPFTPGSPSFAPIMCKADTLFIFDCISLFIACP